MNKIPCKHCRTGLMHDIGLYPMIKCSNPECGKIAIDYAEKLFEKPSRAITERREPEYVPVINQYERS